jgi:orotidine-5'-phosphate decarboxylase
MSNSSIFLALDGMSVDRAMAISTLLGPHVAGGKANDLIEEGGAKVLDAMGFRLRMLDPKINDISATVANRVAKYAGHADFLTLHASMSPKARKLGAEVAREHKIKAIAVTVLTDITPAECRNIFGRPSLAKVVDLAMRARQSGFEGVVCSPREVGHIRRLWEEAIIIVPGVRSEGADKHDQKRTGTPYQAIIDGATYIVCGRQILSQPTFEEQIAEAERINEEVRKAKLHLSM